ncbi:hypothetical protein K523DRAFT_105767 [Schizophyllum commune Tattone D]|nr:hypothetical protein K523DRAFT_105767 [Schizophyllum commune Tattone D]
MLTVRCFVACVYLALLLIGFAPHPYHCIISFLFILPLSSPRARRVSFASSLWTRLPIWYRGASCCLCRWYLGVRTTSIRMYATTSFVAKRRLAPRYTTFLHIPVALCTRKMLGTSLRSWLG